MMRSSSSRSNAGLAHQRSGVAQRTYIAAACCLLLLLLLLLVSPLPVLLACRASLAKRQLVLLTLSQPTSHQQLPAEQFSSTHTL